ncbi:MAG: hypothetical protein U9P38_05090 [Campylobacterota bacterium]|nr:hypothetical protein [Campylobacterota bacterium]
MSKLVQALLSGIFFTYFIDFFLFLGIKIHYIDFYEIDLYYNILFADNQNIFIYLFFTTLIGYLVIYLNATTIKVTLVGLLLTLSFSTMIQPIGHSLGVLLFMNKNITFKTKKHSFNGDIYYNGRQKITFFDYDLNKIITLDKKELR